MTEGLGEEEKFDYGDQSKIITTNSTLHCMALQNLSNTSHNTSIWSNLLQWSSRLRITGISLKRFAMTILSLIAEKIDNIVPDNIMTTMLFGQFKLKHCPEKVDK